ncbi:MAG: hypothetical protein U0835_05350 [Isosphaeraceae bacterium]
MRSRTLAGCLLSVVFIFTACGCSFSDTPSVPTSTEEAEVKGTVKVRGKPVNNGTIVFHSANIGRATKDVLAKIEKDGTYSAKTVVGQCTVIVDCKELNNKQNRQLLEAAEQAVTIEPGSNTLDINIPPQ